MKIQSYINKNVTISIDDLHITGMLTNHKPNLYQVTGTNNHFVFWEYEVIAYSLEKSNNHLTIYI